MKKTITIKGYSGDKEVDKDTFIIHWADYMKQLYSLSWDHRNEIEQMHIRIAEIATIEFDRIYDRSRETAK